MISMGTAAVGLFLMLSGLLFWKVAVIASGFLLLFVGLLISPFYAGVESILLLNRDLQNGQSSILWMVPRSVMQIFGAKYLAAVLQTLFSLCLFSSVCFFFPALLGVAAFLLFCFPEPYRRIPDMADFFPFFCSGRSILPAIARRRMPTTPFSVSSIYKTYSCSLHGINPNLAESLLSFRYNKEKPVRGI